MTGMLRGELTLSTGPRPKENKTRRYSSLELPLSPSTEKVKISPCIRLTTPPRRGSNCSIDKLSTGPRPKVNKTRRHSSLELPLSPSTEKVKTSPRVRLTTTPRRESNCSLGTLSTGSRPKANKTRRHSSLELPLSPSTEKVKTSPRVRLTTTPRRESNSSLGKIGSKRRSYLSKGRNSMHGDVDDIKARKEQIRSSIFSNIDSLVGGELENHDSEDISFQKEDSYLKRLLLSPMTSSSGVRGKKLSIDNAKGVRRKKKPNTNKPTSQRARNAKAKSKQEKTGLSPMAAKNPNISRVKDGKRLSMESTDSNTATTEGSESTLDCCDMASMDYTHMLRPYKSHNVEVIFDADEDLASDRQRRKVSFASQAQQAFVEDLIIWASDTTDGRQDYFGTLFYTDDELADQKHDAFLEMCGLLDLDHL